MVAAGRWPSAGRRWRSLMAVSDPEKPRALITGIAGQDGSYLAEWLLEKKYEVHGIVRQQPDRAFPNLKAVQSDVTLHWADLQDAESLERAVIASEPDEVYNFAAAAYVPTSLGSPFLTAEVTGVGAARLFEAVRKAKPDAKVLQASTSEMFAGDSEERITPATPLRPRNPYGAAKAYAHLMAIQYREVHNLACWTAIAFNHESPRRREGYVSRKITRAAVEIALGQRMHLMLGNLDAKRDWGYAKEYVQGMWRLLQATDPDDYVIATGNSHTVREFARLAFELLGLDADEHIRVDDDLLREGDMDLFANPEETFRALQWRPGVDLPQLVKIMVKADYELLTGKPLPQRDLHLARAEDVR
jgi:GDPmannose 4,6-dehydratase